MKKSNIKKTEKDKYDNKEALEIASDRLAEIIVSWIELNRNKDKNAYEERE